jgi:hypothetical protein
MQPTIGSSRPSAIRIMVIGWCVTGLIGLAASLATISFDRSPTTAAAQLNLTNLWPYWAASAWLWIGLSALWIVLRREATVTGGRPTPWRRRDAWAIVVIAIAVRAIVLITHNPALSDDVYRYIFEGRTFAAGINPYLVKGADRVMAVEENFPGERLLIDTPREISTTDLMTYGELATPYLPVSHLVFGGLGLIIRAMPDWSDPLSSARVFRAGFTGVELIAICLMLMACRRSERSAWWVALYAWHPLAISEIAGSGHQDINGITLMIGGLLAYSLAPRKVWRWALVLALAVLVKPIAGAAGLMIVRTTQRDEVARTILRAAMVAIPVALILLSPFWVFAGEGGQAFANWRATVGLLAEKWAHFGGLYESALAMMRRLLPAEGQPAGYNLVQELAARRVCMVVLLISSALIVVRSRDVWRGTAAMLVAVVLCTTTAHPWYLLWALALFPMANLLTIWVLSLTLPLGYAVFTTLGRPDWPLIPAWIYVVAYAPVLAAIIADVVGDVRRARLPLPAKPQAAETYA